MIERLPPELLLKIFFEIQRTPTAWTMSTQRLPSCSAVSQVCRQWRSIALGASHLWSCIPVDSPQWAKACISRSRPSCIEVEASILIAGEGEHAQRQSLLLVYPELPRISLLEFGTQTNHADRRELLAEVFDGLSVRPALMLRELSFSFMDDIDMLPVLLPETLFASQRLISLASANFYSCELSSSWSKTLLAPALRSLTLTESLTWRNIDEMIDFFRLIPNLQSLCLNIFTTDTHSFDTSPSTKYSHRAVSLPKLETFDVSTRYVEELAMMVYLSMPTNASLDMRISEVDWDLMDTNEEDLSATIARGTQAYRDHFSPAITAGHEYTHIELSPKVIKTPYEDPCELHRNQGRRDFRTVIPAELAPISIPFGFPMSEPRLFRQAYAMLLEQPVFETASTICVHGPLQEVAWACFERWTAVETLELSKFGEHSALPSFAASMCGQSFRLFPALRELCIVDSTVIEDDTTAPWGESVESEGLRGKYAREFVAAMREIACYEHFERLTFIRCIVSMQVLRAVREILGPQRVGRVAISPEKERRARKEERRERIIV